MKFFASSAAVLAGHSCSGRPAMDWADITTGRALPSVQHDRTGEGGLPQASTMPTVQRFGKVQLLFGFVTEEPLPRP